MSFVTIYFYVIMLYLLVNAVPGGIQDVSDACTNLGELNYILTAGETKQDAVVLKVDTDEKFNCTLSFLVEGKSYTGMIFKFPAMGSDICIVEEDSVVTVSNWNSKINCIIPNENGMYSKITEGSSTAEIFSEGNLMKFTITAAILKNAENGQCSNGEMKCPLHGETYCFPYELKRQQIIPCGFNDTNATIDNALSGPVIIFTIAMTVTTVVIIVAVLWNIFPRRGRTFIYKIDEQLTPYDTQFSNLNIEVVVLVVFPNELDKKNE